MSMKQWELKHGCIRQDDSITSRDNAWPETYDTKDEAQEALNKHAAWYRSIGYKVWHSSITEISVDKGE